MTVGILNSSTVHCIYRGPITLRTRIILPYSGYRLPCNKSSEPWKKNDLTIKHELQHVLQLVAMKLSGTRSSVVEFYHQLPNCLPEVLAKFQLLGGGKRRRGVVKTQSAKSWPNFNGEGGGHSGVVKTQSGKSCPNFHFWGGGGVFWTKFQLRVKWDFWTKISTTAASYCIADSLSHTTHVETNKVMCQFRQSNTISTVM